LEILSKEKSVKSIEDLKGKELVVPWRGDMPDLVLQSVIKQKGLKEDDIKLLKPSRTGRNTYVQITVDIGKNRVVRRFFDRFDHGVLKLKRVAIGPLKLGNLPRGMYRELTPEEVKKLKQVAGLEEK